MPKSRSKTLRQKRTDISLQGGARWTGRWGADFPPFSVSPQTTYLDSSSDPVLPLTDSKGASSCNQQLARGVTGSRSCCYQSCYQRRGQRRGGADKDCSVWQSSSDKDAGEYRVWNFLLRRSGRFTALMPALLSLQSFQHYILAQLHRLNFHKELQLLGFQGDFGERQQEQGG